MDDDLQQLEAELTCLRPAAPPPEMLARLDAALACDALAAAEARVARRWWIWAGTLPIAAALVVALIVAVRRGPSRATVPSEDGTVARPGPSAPAENVFKPIAAENVLYAVSDEGFVTLDDGTAARRERLSYVDTITWKNPCTNASVRWTVPREEIRVVPVKFQ